MAASCDHAGAGLPSVPKRNLMSLTTIIFTYDGRGEIHRTAYCALSVRVMLTSLHFSQKYSACVILPIL